jgi:hypothetical protein
MRYDLGYFNDETCRLEPIDKPFAPKMQCKGAQIEANRDLSTALAFD